MQTMAMYHSNKHNYIYRCLTQIGLSIQQKVALMNIMGTKLRKEKEIHFPSKKKMKYKSVTNIHHFKESMTPNVQEKYSK